MNTPSDRKYSTDHEWVSVEEGTATLGITDYAQDALGDVVFVELPEVGARTVAGEAMCEVESTKSVSDIISPIDGEVTEVNDALDDDPTVLNSDPYGAGWICRIRADDASHVDALMGADEYEALISSDG